MIRREWLLPIPLLMAVACSSSSDSASASPGGTGGGGGAAGAVGGAGGATASGGTNGAGGHEVCLVCGGASGAGGVTASGGGGGGGKAGSGGSAPTSCAAANGTCMCGCGNGTYEARALTQTCPQPCPTCGACSMFCCLTHPVEPFPCGTGSCTPDQVCVHPCSGIGPQPAPHCAPLPPACGADATCGCLPSDICGGAGSCQDSMNQGRDIICFGCA